MGGKRLKCFIDNLKQTKDDKNMNKATNNHSDALEHADGTKHWFQNDKLHRDNDLPAVEDADGTKFWYQNDKLHRDNDLPAVERADGSKFWYQNGQRHRDNDLPAIEYADGSKEWWIESVKQPNKIAKCYWIENNKKQFKWFKSEQEAKNHMKMMLRNKICSWVEKN